MQTVGCMDQFAKIGTYTLKGIGIRKSGPKFSETRYTNLSRKIDLMIFGQSGGLV